MMLRPGHNSACTIERVLPYFNLLPILLALFIDYLIYKSSVPAILITHSHVLTHQGDCIPCGGSAGLQVWWGTSSREEKLNQQNAAAGFHACVCLLPLRHSSIVLIDFKERTESK
jgi:hypothetical protein